MARRTGLREFQLSVAERIRTAATRAALASRLGFQVGADNWFVPLHQVNEVIPSPQILPVPRTHSWFRGVANVRGNLYTILDFSAFVGGEPIAPGAGRRVLPPASRALTPMRAAPAGSSSTCRRWCASNDSSKSERRRKVPWRKHRR